ncbi:MAG: polysaccharide deacetylase family protein [Oscillospiraceae bacterium]|jgi:peptidoglycan-N-acetylmuramic acid deacetylase|nr:polysaccharide deacetylase family protein [Oscillospiraceae bacterium]
MKKLILTALVAAFAFAATGCEPNVDDNGVVGTTEDKVNLTPRDTENNLASDNDLFPNGSGGNIETNAGDITDGRSVTDSEAVNESETPFDTENGMTSDTDEATETGLAARGASPAAVLVSLSEKETNSAGVMSEKKIGWGLGKDRDCQNTPIDATAAQEKYGGLSAYFVGTDATKVYLTFDEGYENGYTADILDTLKEKGVKATFFITGDYAKKETELVKRMIAEGHAVGNHTMNHPSTPDLPEGKVREEVAGLHEYVKANYGYEMTQFRFPMGEFSERDLAAVKSLGYKSVFWTFAYKDWERGAQPDKAQSLDKIKSSLCPGEIVLLHAVSSTNAQILPTLIDYWRDAGYQIGTL